MIESITVAKVATYAAESEELSGLSKFNYIFGANGTGKTTISRLIANDLGYASCKVIWKDGKRLQAMVYNRDFVERNVQQTPELKGVFTLGEKQVDTLAKINKAKGEVDDLTQKIQSLTKNLQGDDGSGGKRGALAAVESHLKTRCWTQKAKHDEKLGGAFEGYRNSSEKFKNKVLSECASNKASLCELHDLENRAATVFGQAPSKESAVTLPDSSRLLSHESNPILAKRVIGKEDVDIAAMIKKLGNSDWVQEGRKFYAMNSQVCPFCQQATDEAFSKSLGEYFDDTFTADSKRISDLVAAYSADASRLQQQLAALIGSPSRFLDVEKLTLEKELIDAKIAVNNQRLAEKKKEASRQFELDSLANVLAAIKAIVDSANSKINAHNQMVENLTTERRCLSQQVWRYVLEVILPRKIGHSAKYTGS